jgi:L-lactate utilization protein LutC
MTPRDQFLQRVRQAVALGNQAGQAPPLPERAPVGAPGADPDPVERFRTELEAAGGRFHLITTASAVLPTVLRLLQGWSARRILVGGGPLLERLALIPALQNAGLEVSTGTAASPESRFAAEAGVSGVDYLIAATGSVVLASRPEQPRSLSLLPPVHLAIAQRGQLLPDLFDLLHPARWPEGLPSCLSVITGPSKTGDIELRLVTGVHGPGEVHVLLLAESL